MKKQLKYSKKYNLLAVAFLLALVTPFQNCGRMESRRDEGAVDMSSNSLQPGETSVPVSLPRKVDTIAHGGTVALTLISALGITGSGIDSALDANNNVVSGTKSNVEAVLDSSYSQSSGYLPLILLSEYGSADSATPAHMNALNRISKKACEKLIANQEINLLKVSASGQVTDDRRYFRGIYMGFESDAARIYPLTNQTTRTGELSSAAHPDNAGYVADQNYRAAIKRLARSLWGRDSTTDEENIILDKTHQFQAIPANAAKFRAPAATGNNTKDIGYRSSVFICSAMASSMSAVQK